MFTFPLSPALATHDALRSEVRSFLHAAAAAGHFAPVCSGWVVADRRFSLLCGERGYIGMTWPKQYGGGARSNLERYIVAEEMLAAGAPVGAHWIADRQSGPQILRHGSEELRRRVLSRIARGEICFAIGMSEPGAGSDLAAIRSRAVRVAGGWRVHGRKMWTTHAHVADYMIGLFRTGTATPEDRHSGMTQLAIDLKSAGVSVHPVESSAGRHELNEVVFEDVFVPDSHVIGAPGEGWRLVTAELQFERSGPERFLSVFPLLVAAVRHASGTEVRSSGAAQLGRLVAHIAALREMSMSVAARLDSSADVATEAALIKDLGNALEQETPDVLRRAFDTKPLRDGDDYPAMLADAQLSAPSFTLRGGTPQILRGILARALGMR